MSSSSAPAAAAGVLTKIKTKPTAESKAAALRKAQKVLHVYLVNEAVETDSGGFGLISSTTLEVRAGDWMGPNDKIVSYAMQDSVKLVSTTRAPHSARTYEGRNKMMERSGESSYGSAKPAAFDLKEGLPALLEILERTKPSADAYNIIVSGPFSEQNYNSSAYREIVGAFTDKLNGKPCRIGMMLWPNTDNSPSVHPHLTVSEIQMIDATNDRAREVVYQPWHGRW